MYIPPPCSKYGCMVYYFCTISICETPPPNGGLTSGRHKEINATRCYLLQSATAQMIQMIFKNFKFVFFFGPCLSQLPGRSKSAREGVGVCVCVNGGYNFFVVGCVCDVDRAGTGRTVYERWAARKRTSFWNMHSVTVLDNMTVGAICNG